MPTSKFFINGVFESVIEEILKSQKLDLERVHFLQPHSKTNWKQFSEEKMPTTLFITLTTDYNTVTHQCEILSCRNKSDLTQQEMDEYNKRLQLHQPTELTATREQTDEDPFSVLIEI
jgi:hypothetical protein